MLNTYGTIEHIWNTPRRELLRSCPQHKNVLTRFVNERNAIDLEKEWHSLDKQRISIIGFTEKKYPELLKHIPSPPVVLYIYGNEDALDLNGVSIVGTRKITDYGIHALQTLIPEIVASSLITISGLAFGVDAHVHSITLENSGQTIAVIPGGISPITPRSHTSLAERIVHNGGAIIAEYPPGVPTTKQFYARRNRIIAGLSLVTTVIEAPVRSGALITAYQALEYNRTVCALPGRIDQPYSKGCNTLIQKGAWPVLSAADILEQVPHTDKGTPSNPIEKQILAYMTLKRTLTIQDLTEAMNIPESTLLIHLTKLELNGFVKQSGSYVQSL